MLSTIPSCGSFTFQPWTRSKRHRYSSIGHNLNIAHGDERIAAMLHGKERNRGENVASKRTPPEPPRLQPSRHRARDSAQSTRRRKKQHWKGRGSNWKKRESAAVERAAAVSQSEPTAKVQRSNAPKLKDEAYIRSTMRMPTPQDYPSLPQDVFKTPRSSILNIAHGFQLAECRSDVVALAKNVYQCTLYYNSAMHNEAVVGEGRTEASRSIL